MRHPMAASLAVSLAALTATGYAATQAQERSTLPVVNVRANDVLMVREYPTKTSRVVRTIPPRATGIETSGEVEREWIFVQFRDMEGWVSRAFVRRDVRRGRGPDSND